MRPVRFVALSEDGQALVLADEVGPAARPADRRADRRARCTPSQAHRRSRWRRPPPTRRRRCRRGTSRPASAPASPPRTSPGSPACRSTGCCATPARCCRSGRCSPSTPAAPGSRARRRARPLAEVVDARLGQHGIDTEKISWDAYRRDDGTWRIVATWPSRQGHRAGDLGARQGPPAGRPARRHGAVPVRRAAHADPRPGAGAGAGRARPARSVARRAEPWRARAAGGVRARRARAATRSGPAGTRCSPRWTVRSAPLGPRAGAASPAALAGSDAPRQRPVGGGAAALLGGGQGSAFDDDARRAQGGAGRAVAGGAAAPPDGRRGGRRRRVDRRHRQAAQAAAELGRRALRQRPGRPRILLTLSR